MSSDAPRRTSRHRLRAIFSDLDGTLVHFPAWFEEHGTRIISMDAPSRSAVLESPSGERRACRVLPSSTMGPGMVSERTVELVDALRNEGVLFVVVTAARKSTLLERLPLLPACDAAVCETGARMYVDGELDTQWASRFTHICGDLERELDVAERPEPLWAFYRALGDTVPGLKRDSRSYYGCFRVDTLGDAQVEAALRAAIDAEMPNGVATAMNLGKFDFFPALAGKGNAVAYLQERFHVRRDECACLFDDDNDLPMARLCDGARLLPGLTSDSVRRAAEENADWVVASRAGEGVFAVEECLEMLLARVRAEKAAEAAEGGAGEAAA